MKLQEVMQRVKKNFQSSQNCLKYAMNGFLIAAAAYIPKLTENAISIAGNIGKVKVDMGGTTCKVPEVASYIQKTIERVNKKKR